MNDPRAAVLVFAGGASGTAARYLLEQAYPVTPGGWPSTTFAINLAGAFVLGLLLEGLARRGPEDGPRRQARLLLGTGLCGGFTTYSTLALETDALARAAAPGLALLYPVVSLVAGVLAAAGGVLLARRTAARP